MLILSYKKQKKACQTYTINYSKLIQGKFIKKIMSFGAVYLHFGRP